MHANQVLEQLWTALNHCTFNVSGTECVIEEEPPLVPFTVTVNVPEGVPEPPGFAPPPFPFPFPPPEGPFPDSPPQPCSSSTPSNNATGRKSRRERLRVRIP